MAVLSDDEKVQLLIKQMGDSVFNLEESRAYLRMVIENESWRQFSTPNGNPVEHKRFADFVTGVPWRGLGSSVQDLRTLAGDDVRLVDILDQAVQNKPGRPPETVDNVHGFDRPAGNSSDAALRRLRKDRPDLHADVLAGNLSAHKAMVEAGFRPRTITVRPDYPDSLVTSLHNAGANLEAIRDELNRVLDDGGEQ